MRNEIPQTEEWTAVPGASSSRVYLVHSLPSRYPKTARLLTFAGRYPSKTFSWSCPTPSNNSVT